MAGTTDPGGNYSIGVVTCPRYGKCHGVGCPCTCGKPYWTAAKPPPCPCHGPVSTGDPLACPCCGQPRIRFTYATTYTNQTDALDPPVQPRPEALRPDEV